MGRKRCKRAVNSRHGIGINGGLKRKEEEDNGRIKKISKKGRHINRKRGRGKVSFFTH
jgi:hypothetical protein